MFPVQNPLAVEQFAQLRDVEKASPANMISTRYRPHDPQRAVRSYHDCGDDVVTTSPDRVVAFCVVFDIVNDPLLPLVVRATTYFGHLSGSL
jgi:hypothetical protein